MITGDTWNLVLLLHLSTSCHGHTLVTDSHTNIHIQHTNLTHQLTELIGSTKEPSRGFPNTFSEEQTSLVRVIYTACCCSASNLAFMLFNAFHFGSRNENPDLVKNRTHDSALLVICEVTTRSLERRALLILD